MKFILHYIQYDGIVGFSFIPFTLRSRICTLKNRFVNNQRVVVHKSRAQCSPEESLPLPCLICLTRFCPLDFEVLNRVRPYS